MIGLNLYNYYRTIWYLAFVLFCEPYNEHLKAGPEENKCPILYSFVPLSLSFIVQLNNLFLHMEKKKLNIEH